ncbi:MAG: PAS domain-containing protein [Deltaproteobacteria bacterium]|nr:PAS domain-containing protein [Deltaproteobacteria bacterium]
MPPDQEQLLGRVRSLLDEIAGPAAGSPERVVSVLRRAGEALLETADAIEDAGLPQVPLPGPDGNTEAILLLATEVTDLVGARQGFAAGLDAAARLQQLSTRWIGADGVECLYEEVLDTAVALLRADFGSFQMLEPERGPEGELRLLAHRGFGDEAIRFWEWVRPASRTTCGEALRTGERVLVPDVEACEFMAGSDDREVYLRTGIRAVQTTPLFSRSGTLLGMLSTHWREPRESTPRELQALDALARQAADLIDRRRAEAAVKKSEELLRFALETTHTGAWDLDLVDHSATRSLEHDRIFGYRELLPEWTYELFLEHVLPEDRDGVDRKFRSAQEAGSDWDFECRIRRVDGELRWIRAAGRHRRDASGAPRRMTGIVQDITDRRAAEENLRRSEELYRTLAASRAVGSVVVLDHVLRYVVAVGEGLGPAGVERASFVGRTIWEALDPATAATYEPFFRGALRGDPFEHEHESHGRCYVSRGVPLRDGRGEVTHLLALSYDVTERRRSEDELRQALAAAEERGRVLDTIFEHVPEGLTLAAAPDVRILRVSRYGQELTGKAVSALEGISADRHVQEWDLYCEDGATRAANEDLPLTRATQGGEVVRNEVWVLGSPDGRRIPILCNAAPIRDPQGNVTGGLIAWRDVTELQRAQNVLRESELFYRQTLESIPGMVFTTRPDGYCDYQSQQWVDFTGVPMEEHLGDGWNRLLHPDDRPRAFAAWQAAIEGRAPYDLEYRIRRCDGVHEWFKVQGRPIRNEAGQVVRWLGTALNIHRLVEAQDAVRKSQERFRLLSETAARLLASDDPQRLVEELCRDVMAHLDCQAFFNFLVDEAAGRLRLNACAGIPEEEARRIEWLDYGVAVCGCVAQEGHRIIAEDIPNAADPRTELVASYGVRAYCCHPLTAQGRLIGTLSFGTRTRTWFADDEIEVMRTIADQVATAMQRVRTERELRDAKEAAEAANRAKSDFLARMSHEIRTPMNGIMGMTELALMEEALPQRARDFLGLSKESAKGLLEIINDILDVARIEAGRVELEEKSFALSASARDLLAPLRATAERKGLRLSLHLSPELPTQVLGDEGRLRQVLTNLVGNALKFSDRGEVEVSVRPADGAELPAGRLRLLFAVRDQGIGIPPENLCTVFDSFSAATRSTHVRFGGTGLGLSIAKQLVELMGGTIWAESEVGRGSLFQFTVELGLPAAGTSTVATASVRPRGGSNESLRILVAEDNPLNQLFAKELLLRLGHEAVLVSDGGEALRALSRERFDAALLDVQMPVLDGDEVTRRVRAGSVDGCPVDLPIVALTAHAIQGDRERFLAAGMDDYLSKPFHPDTVEDVLYRVLERKQKLRQA